MERHRRRAILQRQDLKIMQINLSMVKPVSIPFYSSKDSLQQAIRRPIEHGRRTL